MPFDPAPAAADLMRRRAAREVAGPLAPDIRPSSVEEGVAVQHEVARRVGALPPGGFKLGATGKRMQAFLGLPGPAAGFMRAGDIFDTGTNLPYARFATPQVECELAVRLARDIPPGDIAPEAAAEAVGALMSAIEIVENRYGTPPIGDLDLIGTPTLIADQVYHAACVVGVAPEDWRRLDPGALTGRISVDGEERDHGAGTELLGHPWRALAWLAGSEVARQFGGLRAGQVVMLGSVTPSITLTGACVVRVEFAPLPATEIRFV